MRSGRVEGSARGPEHMMGTSQLPGRLFPGQPCRGPASARLSQRGSQRPPEFRGFMQGKHAWAAPFTL